MSWAHAAGAAVALLTSLAILVFLIVDRTGAPAAERFPVDGHPTGLVVADGRVWVAAPRSGTVTVLDAATGRRIGDPLRVIGAPSRVAVGASGVWLADSTQGTVIPVQRDPELAYPPIRLGADVTDVALAGRAVWAVSSPEGVVRTVEPGGRIRRFPVGSSPVDIDADDRRVVVASAAEGTLTWFDARTRRQLHAPRRVAAEPVAVALDGDVAWVTDVRRGTVTRVDARTGRPSSPAVLICSRPIAVAADGDDVYALCARERELVQLDARELRVTSRRPAGVQPVALALDGSRVWVADGERDEVLAYER
ncbi:MAG TPA: PQQ-binding-like beta-propeller repeat protein [Solirubrobacteraceae bacterium]|nr:PQQ-binding-like beta-propeller repeat protein [Solirubrobacteraceae bacterium]